MIREFKSTSISQQVRVGFQEKHISHSNSDPVNQKRTKVSRSGEPPESAHRLHRFVVSCNKAHHPISQAVRPLRSHPPPWTTNCARGGHGAESAAWATACKHLFLESPLRSAGGRAAAAPPPHAWTRHGECARGARGSPGRSPQCAGGIPAPDVLRLGDGSHTLCTVSKR